jgi:hypothetical protein
MISILYQSKVGSYNAYYGSLIWASGPYNSIEPDDVDFLLDPIVKTATRQERTDICYSTHKIDCYAVEIGST